MLQSIIGKWEESCRRHQVNARVLQLECVRVLHKSLLILVLLYDSKNDMERKGNLGLGLCKWTTSEVCWVLDE